MTGFFLGHDKEYIGVMHTHKEQEMEEVGDYISELLNQPEDEKLIRNIKMKIRSLCKRFPLYSERLARYDIPLLPVGRQVAD